MFLSRFGVKNYKCLGDVDIPLTPIHVLIGPNDSGKTSLLEAMAAFCGSSEKPLNEVFPEPWFGRELIRQRAPTGAIEFRGEWMARNGLTLAETARIGYVLNIGFPIQGRDCRTVKEAVAHGDTVWPMPDDRQAEGVLIRWKHGRLSSRPLVSRCPPNLLSSMEPSECLAPLSALLKPVHKYSLHPKIMAVPAAIDPDRKFRLDPDGFGLATLVDDIAGYDPERFLQLRAEFCRFFPQFKSVRIETERSLARTFEPGGIHRSKDQTGKGIYFETTDGAIIRSQQASDGAILFLGLLALAFLPEPPNLLLVEEPENGIYPKRLAEVVQLLKSMIRKSDATRLPQIIMSTHSPYLVSFFEPDEVTFLTRPTGDPVAPVRARPLRDAPHIHDRLAGGEFYLGELWYNLTEEELFGDS